jgi:hypothetical protein
MGWSSLRFPYPLLAVVLCIGVTRVVADGRNYINAPSAGQVVPVEQPFLIQWIPGTPGPVFIALKGSTQEGERNITS